MDILEEGRYKNDDVLFNLRDSNREQLITTFLTQSIGLRAIFKTDIIFKDLYEAKDQEKINKLVLDTQLDFKGLPFKSQVFACILKLILFNYSSNNLFQKTLFNLIIDATFSFLNGNLKYKITNNNLFENLVNFTMKQFFI